MFDEIFAVFSGKASGRAEPDLEDPLRMVSPQTEQQTEISMLSQSASSAAVVGPDGRHITLADLPLRGSSAWVTRRKAEVVAAVHGGLLTSEDALPAL